MHALRIAAAAIFTFACSPQGKAPAGDKDYNPGEEIIAPPTPEAMALAEPPRALEVVSPDLNARRGRILFVTKGCVVCHQANGVGGKAAPRLDPPNPDNVVDPLAFAARMWRGAPAMTALQDVELGYGIELDAQDIGDLAAFLSTPEETALLALDSVPKDLQDWFLDERFWESGEWDDYRSRGTRIPLD